MVRRKLKYLVLFTMSSVAFALAEPIPVKPVKSSKKKSIVSMSSSMLEFKYDSADLKDILNDYAELRGINLVYPEADPITTKVTFDAGKKITMLEAWEFVIMILDQAGFTLVHHDDHTYFIVANKKAAKEAVPLYINIDYQALPDSQEKIRYVYSCNSIQLTPSKQLTEVTTILTNLFAVTPAELAEKVVFEDSINSIIFTASSESIKSVMRLISIFDEVGFKETVEILELKYAQASEVATILTSMIGADPKKANGFVSLTASPSKARYFSEHATVLDLDGKGIRKLNSLVIMGRSEDVEHIKDFIQKYLDIPQQQGKSFFHVVELEWIQSSVCLTALQALKGAGGASGQSTGVTATALAFDPQIQIIAEAPSQGPAPAANSASAAPAAQGAVASANVGQRGGNRIIIASSERDWVRLESVIKQIDVPRKQVIIEALIVDLDLEFVRRLATQLRTRGLTPTVFPKYMQAQAGLVLGNVINSITDAAGNTSYDLAGDLSNMLSGATNAPVGGFTPPGVSLSNNGQVPWNQNFGAPGEDGPSGQNQVQPIPGFNSSTVFMIDGSQQTNGVWAFFQLLSTHKSAKILTRPVIIASNNQPANLTSAQLKNLAGGVTSANSPTVNYSLVPAAIAIGFTPVISANNVVNLQINMTLDLWQDAASEQNGTQIKRTLNTNISMKSGNIMVLGGLIKEVATRSKKSIPLLDKIPVLGSFVANRYKNTTRDQLFILLRPTVVTPRTEGGMGSATKQASNYMMQQFQDYEDAFSNLKDPITRWFFNEDADRASVQLDGKMTDLGNPKNPNVEMAQLEQVDQFFKPQYNKNPLGVKWLSDEEGIAKSADPKLVELGKKLDKVVNPFANRLTL